MPTLKHESMRSQFQVVLASEPYYEGTRVIRCDCFLLGDDGKAERPPALIQLASAPRVIHHELPAWHAGQVLRMDCSFFFWRDEKHQSGRCYLQLHVVLSSDKPDDFIAGLIPINPDLDKFFADL